MQKILYLIAFLPLSHAGFGQNLQINFVAKGTLAFPTINDETFVRPLPVDQNSAYTSYYLTPADVDRSVVARPGIELGIDLKWKPENKWHFSTGLKVQMTRYRIEPEYKVPDTGAFGEYIDSLRGTPFGTLYGYTRPNPSPVTVVQLSDHGINTNLFYASLPLALEYRISKSFFLSGGMELSALLFAQQTYYTIVYRFAVPAPVISEQQISDTEKSGFSTVQTNLQAGIHYRLHEKITLDLSFSGGLRNIYSNTAANAKNGSFNSRLRLVALGCSYAIR